MFEIERSPKGRSPLLIFNLLHATPGRPDVCVGTPPAHDELSHAANNITSNITTITIIKSRLIKYSL
jgi:hypothetical protein